MTVTKEDQERFEEDPLSAPLPEDKRPTPCPLDAVYGFIDRFVYATEAEKRTIALWIAHTYVFKGFYASPRLGVFADKENAGKSTVLGMANALAASPVKTMNASAAAIFAIIEQEQPTLLIDETDNIFGSTGTGDKGRQLRGILNEGYTDDGFVLRSRGGAAHRFPVYVAAAFAGVGRLPRTMMSRCVIINMKRCPSNVELEEFEPQKVRKEATKIAEALKHWVTSRGPELNPDPVMPEGVHNRDRQIWRVLISIGDAGGEEWGLHARKACRELVLGISASTLLTPAEDLIHCVVANTLPSQFMPTTELIEMLARVQQNEGSIGWADWLSDPMIASRRIAQLLRDYGIESKQKWIDSENRRGYNMADFHLWVNDDTPIANQTGNDMIEAE